MLADYDWADKRRDPSLNALSLTFVEPVDRAYLDMLEPRTELPRALTVAEALDASLEVDDFAWGSVLAQTDTIGKWSVLLEPNGWATSMPEVLARLSKHGRAVNVFWNVNAVMSFCLAREGVVVRQFDPLLYDTGRRPTPRGAGSSVR